MRKFLRENPLLRYIEFNFRKMLSDDKDADVDAASSTSATTTAALDDDLASKPSSSTLNNNFSTLSVDCLKEMEPVTIIGWTRHFGVTYFLVKYNVIDNELSRAKLVPANEFIEKYPDIFLSQVI